MRVESFTSIEDGLWHHCDEAAIAISFSRCPVQPQLAARLSEVARADGANHYAQMALKRENVGVALRSCRLSEEGEFAMLIEELVSRKRHMGSIEAVVWSPDGQRIVSGCEGTQVQILGDGDR